uniref:DNA-directed DNA polymerase n=1 Tax=Clytia hemisphaerica TaxID=252671 RepID=A0A7M5WWR2_9CNID
GFSIGDITFIDSFQFMPSSMAKLASNLAKDQFLQVIRYLKSTTSNKDDNSMNVDGNDISGDYRDHRCYEEPNLSPRQTNEVEERFILLTRKGIYPYEYFDDITRFDETELPPRESFYSTLSEENVSEEDYNHAKNVWNKFEMESLKDYHNLYVLTDVLIMADVFEAFRKNCLQHYQLDPAHYFTAPGMSWEAALKKTGISLQLLTDPDQYLFVEKGIKGGISMITQRYAKANLEDLPNYDPTIKDTHLVYLDANNLYGWAMSQSLPIGNFQWLQDDEIEQFDVSIISDEAEDGFIIECDLGKR